MEHMQILREDETNQNDTSIFTQGASPDGWKSSSLPPEYVKRTTT